MNEYSTRRYSSSSTTTSLQENDNPLLTPLKTSEDNPLIGKELQDREKELEYSRSLVNGLLNKSAQEHKQKLEDLAKWKTESVVIPLQHRKRLNIVLEKADSFHEFDTLVKSNNILKGKNSNMPWMKEQSSAERNLAKLIDKTRISLLQLKDFKASYLKALEQAKSIEDLQDYNSNLLETIKLLQVNIGNILLENKSYKDRLNIWRKYIIDKDELLIKNYKREEAQVKKLRAYIRHLKDQYKKQELRYDDIFQDAKAFTHSASRVHEEYTRVRNEFNLTLPDHLKQVTENEIEQHYTDINRLHEMLIKASLYFLDENGVQQPVTFADLQNDPEMLKMDIFSPVKFSPKHDPYTDEIVEEDRNDEDSDLKGFDANVQMQIYSNQIHHALDSILDLYKNPNSEEDVPSKTGKDLLTSTIRSIRERLDYFMNESPIVEAHFNTFSLMAMKHDIKELRSLLNQMKSDVSNFGFAKADVVLPEEFANLMKNVCSSVEASVRKQNEETIKSANNEIQKLKSSVTTAYNSMQDQKNEYDNKISKINNDNKQLQDTIAKIEQEKKLITRKFEDLQQKLLIHDEEKDGSSFYKKEIIEVRKEVENLQKELEVTKQNLITTTQKLLKLERSKERVSKQQYEDINLDSIVEKPLMSPSELARSLRSIHSEPSIDNSDVSSEFSSQSVRSDSLPLISQDSNRSLNDGDKATVSSEESKLPSRPGSKKTTRDNSRSNFGSERNVSLDLSTNSDSFLPSTPSPKSRTRPSSRVSPELPLKNMNRSNSTGSVNSTSPSKLHTDFDMESNTNSESNPVVNNTDSIMKGLSTDDIEKKNLRKSRYNSNDVAAWSDSDPDDDKLRQRIVRNQRGKIRSSMINTESKVTQEQQSETQEQIPAVKKFRSYSVTAPQIRQRTQRANYLKDNDQSPSKSYKRFLESKREYLTQQERRFAAFAHLDTSEEKDENTVSEKPGTQNALPFFHLESKINGKGGHEMHLGVSKEAPAQLGNATGRLDPRRNHRYKGNVLGVHGLDSQSPSLGLDPLAGFKSISYSGAVTARGPRKRETVADIGQDRLNTALSQQAQILSGGSNSNATQKDVPTARAGRKRSHTTYVSTTKQNYF